MSSGREDRAIRGRNSANRRVIISVLQDNMVRGLTSMVDEGEDEDRPEPLLSV